VSDDPDLSGLSPECRRLVELVGDRAGGVATSEVPLNATGILPRLLNRLNVRGANLPFDIFSERRLEFPSRRRTVR
jgi:hypothetical protein